MSSRFTRLTCHGQLPGLASTPPITRMTDDTPQSEEIKNIIANTEGACREESAVELIWFMRVKHKSTITGSQIKDSTDRNATGASLHFRLI